MHLLSPCSITKLYPTLCNPMNCSTPGFSVHHYIQSSLKLMSNESKMLSNHLILCQPLCFLPSVSPSIRIFSNESALCIRWPKDWRFSSSRLSANWGHSEPGWEPWFPDLILWLPFLLNLITLEVCWLWHRLLSIPLCFCNQGVSRQWRDWALWQSSSGPGGAFPQ